MHTCHDDTCVREAQGVRHDCHGEWCAERLRNRVIELEARCIRMARAVVDALDGYHDLTAAEQRELAEARAILAAEKEGGA